MVVSIPFHWIELNWEWAKIEIDYLSIYLSIRYIHIVVYSLRDILLFLSIKQEKYLRYTKRCISRDKVNKD